MTLLRVLALIAIIDGVLWLAGLADAWISKKLGEIEAKRFDQKPDAVAQQHDIYRGWFTAGGVPVVPSDHPADCADTCCWEIRLEEMVQAYDWDAFEEEMREAK